MTIDHGYFPQLLKTIEVVCGLPDTPIRHDLLAALSRAMSPPVMAGAAGNISELVERMRPGAGAVVSRETLGAAGGGGEQVGIPISELYGNGKVRP